MRLDELAKQLNAAVVGDGSVELTGVGALDDATPAQLSFYSNPRYAEKFTHTRAGAVCVTRGVAPRPGVNLLVSDDALDCFQRAVALLVQNKAASFTGVHPLAFVDPSATVGAGTTVYPFAFIGAGASVGRDCVIHSGASIYEGCTIGHRVTIHAGASVGVDGFGYATPAGLQHQNPRAGSVVVEDDVEIGAGSVIERAALGTTVVGRGTRMAHLVCIGHGTKLGHDNLIVSQTGIAGKTIVGNEVSMGGQVGVAGHLKIGDRVKIGAVRRDARRRRRHRRARQPGFRPASRPPGVRRPVSPAGTHQADERTRTRSGTAARADRDHAGRGRRLDAGGVKGGSSLHVAPVLAGRRRSRHAKSNAFSNCLNELRSCGSLFYVRSVVVGWINHKMRESVARLALLPPLYIATIERIERADESFVRAKSPTIEHLEYASSGSASYFNCRLALQCLIEHLKFEVATHPPGDLVDTHGLSFWLVHGRT
ncbi:MAG: LpxD N-terminal domain-containing protein [Tepidisphaeraceae bacterium]